MTVPSILFEGLRRYPFPVVLWPCSLGSRTLWIVPLSSPALEKAFDLNGGFPKLGVPFLGSQ